MKVKELIDILKGLPKNSLVVMSSDAEGNSYSPLSYINESGYCGGIVGLLKLTKEDIEEGFSEEDVIDDGEPAVVFYPG